MAGIGEALGAIGLIEPILHACLRSYGLYKLTRDFGEDYQRAERRLQGQRARLKILSETKKENVVAIPENGTDLGAIVVSTLQGMETGFEKCEALMRKYGGRSSPVVRSDLSSPASNSTQERREDSMSTSVSRPALQDVQQGKVGQEARRTLSPDTAPKMSKAKSRSSIFRRSFSKSPSPSDASTTSDNIGTSTDASSTSSIHSPKVTGPSLSHQTSATSLQQGSSIWGRMKWAVEDREEFLSAIESLTRDNDLLESLLRIKSSNNPMFLADFSAARTNDEQFVASTKISLKQLHHELLMMNSKNDISFSLKLSVHEDEDKNVYEDFVDRSFMVHSKVHLLQAHSASKHSALRSTFLLAENSVSVDNVTGQESKSWSLSLDNVTAQESKPWSYSLENEFLYPDASAGPPFQAVVRHRAPQPPGSDEYDRPSKVTLFQDRTSSWQKTENLGRVLRDKRLQSIQHQQSYTHLALLTAFCYASLSFTYLGKTEFPQTYNFEYYDHATVHTSETITINNRNLPGVDTPTLKISLADGSLAKEDQQFPEQLLSPWYSFHFGSRPLLPSTKLFGQRPGINSANSNPVVALGIVLFQIGSWSSLSSSDDMKKLSLEALGRCHEVVRLSGTEVAEITRACLNWTETGIDGKRYDCEEMMVKVYSKLNAYNDSMQRRF